MHVRTKLNLTEKNFQSHSQCLCVTCLEIRLNWVAVYCGELFRESQVLLSRFVLFKDILTELKHCVN